MKNLDKIVHDFDVKVEKKMTPVWAFMQKYFVIFSATFLTVLMAIFLVRVFTDRTQVLTTVIQEDLANIEKILAQIDKECNILDIRSTAAVIDFFTVEKFSGSTVGPLNLAHPDKWKGPFLSQNPTIQQKFYEIVQAKDGYFVVPGQGVTLPNDLVMGKDVVIKNDTLVGPMLQRGGKLYHKGQACAVKIMFKIGDWDAVIPNKATIKNVDEVLREFNEALPFAQLTDQKSNESKLHEDVKTC